MLSMILGGDGSSRLLLEFCLRFFARHPLRLTRLDEHVMCFDDGSCIKKKKKKNGGVLSDLFVVSCSDGVLNVNLRAEKYTHALPASKYYLNKFNIFLNI